MLTLFFFFPFKDYTVRGLFGKATDDFSDTGKLIEKTTFGKGLGQCGFKKSISRTQSIKPGQIEQH